MRYFDELSEVKKNKLRTLLVEVGILPRYKGYDLLKDSIGLYLKGVTKSENIKSAIAEEYGITASAAEKNCIHAISIAEQRNMLKKINAYYGADVIEDNHCSFREFIGLIAEILNEKI